MKWKHDNGYDEFWVIPEEVETLIRLGIKALKKYLAEPDGSTIKGNLMSNYQLNTGDSVVVTLSVTDDVTGATDTFDANSVTASLSSASDTVAVDPSQTFLTITAGSTASVGNTVTVNGSVAGLASEPWVGTYDDVQAVVSPDATTILGVFGTETAPVATDAAPAAVADAPVVDPAFAGNGVGTGAGQINPETGRVNP